MFHQSISKDYLPQKKCKRPKTFRGGEEKKKWKAILLGAKFVLNLLFATRIIVVQNATIIGEGYFAGAAPASFLGGSAQTQLKDRLQLIQLLGM